MRVQALACILAAVLALCAALPAVRGEPDPEKLKSMAETLRMLQSLDKYYAQVARPSPRSSGAASIRDLSHTDLSKVQEAFHKIRLRELDRSYLQRSRPRFGKRGDIPRLEDRLQEVLGGEEPSYADQQRLWDRLIR